MASIALAAYLVTSADAMSMKRIRLPPWRVNGAYSSPMTSCASSSSTPITTRSGCMKSSIAAPSLRNSGLEQTANGDVGLGPIAARTFSAVPTGTVDLVTTILGSFMCRPISRATAEHVLEVGRAVFARRGADGDEDDLRALDRGADVGGEGEPALLLVPLDHRLESRLVDRDLVPLEPGDLLARPRRRRRRRCRSPRDRRRPPARHTRFRSPPHACHASFGIAFRVSTTSLAVPLDHAVVDRRCGR